MVQFVFVQFLSDNFREPVSSDDGEGVAPKKAKVKGPYVPTGRPRGRPLGPGGPKVKEPYVPTGKPRGRPPKRKVFNFMRKVVENKGDINSNYVKNNYKLTCHLQLQDPTLMSRQTDKYGQDCPQTGGPSTEFVFLQIF